MTTEIPPELVEQCIALVREIPRIWDKRPISADQFRAEVYTKAAAIVAELPEPVDPLLIEARAMAHDLARTTNIKWSDPRYLDKYATGEVDNNPASGVSLALAALRRGIEIGGAR